MLGSEEILSNAAEIIDSMPDVTDITDQITEVTTTSRGKTATHTVSKAIIDGDEVTLTMSNNITGRVSENTYNINNVEPDTGSLELSEPLRDSHGIEIDTVEGFEALGSQSNTTGESNRVATISDLSSSIEAMTDMVDTLRDNTDTDEHIKNLKGLLSDMNINHLNPTSLFIKDVESESKGSFNLGTNEVTVERPRTSDRNRQSTATVYVHEVVHAYVGFALRLTADSRMSSLVRRLYEVYDKASQVLTYKDFINEHNPDKVDAEQKARSDYNYVMNNRSENGLIEFISFGLTNPNIRAKLSDTKLGRPTKEETSYWAKLIRVYRSIVSWVGGTKFINSKDKSVTENLFALAKEVSGSNHRAEYASRQSPNALEVFLGKSNKSLKKVIDYLINKVAVKDGETLPLLPTNPTKGDRAVWLAKNLPSLLLDRRFKGEASTILNAMGIKPDGFVQSIMGRMRTIDKYSLEEELDKVLRLATNVDERKQEVKQIITASIKDSFNGTLTPELDKELKSVIVDMDMSLFNPLEVIKFLSSEKNIDEEIATLESTVKDATGKNWNWVKAQITGLSQFLHTHQTPMGINLNAHNIDRGFLYRGRSVSTTMSVEEEIDKLASLRALKMISLVRRTAMAEYFKEQPEGLEFALATMDTMKKEAKEKNLKGYESAIVKGYSVELQDYNINLVIRPVSEEAELKKEGYKLDSTTPTSKLVGNTSFGIFINEDYGTDTYLRGATLLGNLMSKGTTITKLLILDKDSEIKKHALVLSRLKLASTKAAVHMQETGEPLTIADGTNAIPILNNLGTVVDYRFTMNKHHKEHLLNMDTRASEVLGATRAAIHSKVDKVASNKKVMKIISVDMLENAPNKGSLGNNNFIYVKVGKKHNSDIYNVLPKEFLNFIDSHPKKFIQVRHDMLIHYFGYKSASLLNTDFARDNISHSIRKRLQTFSKVEEDAVGLYKNVITTKTLEVIVGNSESNMIQLMQLGNNPVAVVKGFFNEAINVVEYMKILREEAELSLSVDNGIATSAQARRQKHLKEQLNHTAYSNIRELIGEGFFSNINEEVDLNKDKDSSNSIIARTDKWLSRLPRDMRTGIELAYMTRNTDIYKVFEESVHYSDFIARVVYNSFLLKEGVNKRDRMIRVSEAFVNYNVPYSKTEEWLNRKGIINFSKYAFGVQKSINRIKSDKPLYGILSLLLQNQIMDVEDISEQFLLDRSWRNFEFSPLDMLTTLITPSTVNNLLD